MKKILLILFVAKMLSVTAQDIPGARASALGGTALTLSDVWSTYHNQAGLGWLESFSAGAYYENRFLVNELGDRGFSAAMPVGISAFGLSFRSFGYSAFNDSKAGLAYAMRMSEKFSAGLQFNYHNIRIGEDYGSQHTISAEAGFIYRMNQKFSLAAHVFNPTQAKLSEYDDERIPSQLSAGAAYRFSDKVQLLAEIGKDSDQDAQGSAGIEYKVLENFLLRMGVGTDPVRTSFGFGWKFNLWQLDMAASYHSVLGFTPQVSFTYSSKKNQ